MKIEIVTGFACNNFCRFCSIGDRNIHKTTEEIKNEIDKARRESPYELNFTGGEPTLREDLIELISYAKGGFSDIRITTNGRMLAYEDYTKSLVKAGLTGAIFSIHSHRSDVHDYLTSVKGSFEQAICGLKNLSRYSGNVSVNTVINSMNVQDLPELAKMLGQLKVRSVCFIYPTIDGNLLQNINLLPKYSVASKGVIAAVNVLNGVEIPAWALNIPACFLPGHEGISNLMKMNTKMYWFGKETDLDEKKYDKKQKPPVCSQCTVNDICPGIPDDYIDAYGFEEIKPIKENVKENIAKYTTG